MSSIRLKAKLIKKHALIYTSFIDIETEFTQKGIALFESQEHQY